jgi:hypothetical protein
MLSALAGFGAGLAEVARTSAHYALAMAGMAVLVSVPIMIVGATWVGFKVLRERPGRAQ